MQWQSNGEDDVKLSEIPQERFEFAIKQVASEIALSEFGLMMPADHILVEKVVDMTGRTIVRGILRIATQDEQVLKQPRGWWQHFKKDCFPKWLLKRFPVKEEEVWLTRKFPELNIPDSVLGREFVSLSIIDPDDIKVLKKEE